MSPIILCGLDTREVPDTTSACGRRDLHTPSPTGYNEWHEWARKAHADGRRQSRCPGCQRFAIWSPPTRVRAS